MAPKTTEVGGGSATGLGNDFVKWLSQGLNTGTFGTGTPAGSDAVGATGGISAYLNDVLSGGAGKLGGAMGEMVGKESDRGAAALRARFGVGGGSAFGTPAAYAESLFRSESAPKLATAVGGMQQNALSMLLPLFAQMASKGIAQRESITTQNPWLSAASVAAKAGSTAASLFAPAPGMNMSAGGSGMDVMGAMNNMAANPMTMSMTPNNAWMPQIQPLNYTPQIPGWGGR